MAIPERRSRSTADTLLGRSSGIASGQHQGLHRPNDDQRVGQVLDDIGLDDQGEVLEDQLRDRRSRGAPPTDGDEDDSAGGETMRAPH